MTMAALVHTQNLELRIPDKIREACAAYLVVALENRDADRLDEDVERAGELLAELGAVDAYVLEGGSARKLIEAREKAFWTAKAIGADDIIDTVVPRGAMPKFLAAARGLATAAGGGAAGCGHAGDGNVHLAIFCKDPETKKKLMTDIFALAMELGGAISGEHGLGRAKTPYFLDLEDPVKIDLMRRIKRSFDPAASSTPMSSFLRATRNPLHHSMFSAPPHLVAVRQAKIHPRSPDTEAFGAKRSHMPKCVRCTAATASGGPLTSTCAAACRPKRYRRSSPGRPLSRAVGEPG